MILVLCWLWFIFTIWFFCLPQQESFSQCSSGLINVQGRVIDAKGLPVLKVDLDFFHIPTGIKIVTPHDNTDSLGYYNVCVFPPAFYRITFEPLYPYNTHLVGKEISNVDLTQSVILPDIVLDYGWVVAGRATDSLGNPIDSVNLAVDDLITKKRLFTPGDKTDLLGNYRIVIPNGIYRFRYAPAAGRRQLGVQLDTVKVTGRDTTINITVRSGFFINGTVNDTTFNPSGTPISNLTFDLEDTLGKKIFLPRNKSDSTGKFSVVAPAGIFNLLYVPPRDSHFVAKKVRAFLISSDTAIVQVLHRGVLLTVKVRDSLNQPIPSADLDVIRQVPTRNELFTPTDNADSAGLIKVTIPPDSYTIVINPPAGATNFDTLILPGLVNVFSDTSFDVILPGKPFQFVPEKFTLGSNFPNPFKIQTEIPFALPDDAIVEITIYNILGQKIKTLTKGFLQKGEKNVLWNGRNEAGELVPSGVYFYRMTAANFSKTRQMILIR